MVWLTPLSGCQRTTLHSDWSVGLELAEIEPKLGVDDPHSTLMVEHSPDLSSKSQPTGIEYGILNGRLRQGRTNSLRSIPPGAAA